MEASQNSTGRLRTDESNLGFQQRTSKAFLAHRSSDLTRLKRTFCVCYCASNVQQQASWMQDVWKSLSVKGMELRYPCLVTVT